jgi:hypothetical protein
MARPSALTDEKARKIVEASAKGVHIEIAAAAAGVHQSTYSLWKAKGKRDLAARDEREDLPEIDHANHVHEFANANDGECWCGHTRYSAFVERLLQAEAEAERSIVLKIRGAVDKDPKVALYFMERRWPSRWARRDRLSVSTEPDHDTTTTQVEPEPLQARLAKTMAILGRAGRLPNSEER